MEFINIKGNTFYVKGATNSGLYIFDDNSALIIDPGVSGLRPKRIIKLLEKHNIVLKYIINTHEHNDHYGACYELKNYYKDLEILSSDYAKLYIEHPDIFSKYIIGGKSNKFLDEKLYNKFTENINIDKVLNIGNEIINSITFNIIDFKGHTPGSIGILTNDGVLFVGDLLIGYSMLEKYDFLFLYDIEEQIKSLDKLKQTNYDYLVLGHSKKVLSKNESYDLINKHEVAINKYINQIKKQLQNPISIENLLKNIINDNNLSHNYKEYHYFKSSLISIISYLVDREEVNYLLSRGELLYYTQKN